jgi:TonB-dependent receptor
VKTGVGSNEYVRSFVRAVLGVSTLSLSAVAPVLAQNNSAAAADESSGGLQEVVVTGIRASLERSLEVKKDALGVVDAISAEDIGKFPDSNLAAAIQRVPGVSVSRGASALGGVPTSTGAATQITVRGFGPGFNTTLYDGRQMPTALGRNGRGDSSRGFDFSAVGADFVGQVDIMKTPDARLASGAIGATVNVKFPKPLDRPGLRFAASGSTSYAPDEEKATPNGGLLFSDTFADDNFGVLGSVTYSNSKVRANHINNQGWNGQPFAPSKGAFVDPDDPAQKRPAWFIQDWGIYQEHTEDKRIDGRVVLQWRPTGSLLVTLDDNFSRDELEQQQYGYSVWFNAGNMKNITLNEHGTVTDFVQPNTPTDFQGQINASKIRNNITGLNLKWDVGDKQTYEFDTAYAVAELNPNGEIGSLDMDVGYGPSGPTGTNGTDIGITGIGSNSLPYPTSIGPNNDASRFINNGIIGSHVLPIVSNQNKDIVKQFKLMGTWKEDNLQLNYGLSYVTDHQDLKTLDTFQNNDWQLFAGYGPASNNTGGVALPQNLFTGSFGTGGFINGFNNNGNLPSNVLVFDPHAVIDYLQSTTGKVPQLAFNNGSFQIVDEKTTAAFVNLSTEAKINEMPLRINLGVRAEKTQVDSTGIQQLPTGLQQAPSDLTAFIVSYTPPTPVSIGNSYQHVLPNLDLVLALNDEWRLRFDASRTLTRPRLIDLQPALVVPQNPRVGALTANGGNALLQPYTSDNLDLGAEWYYARNSYVSVGLFLKEVTNFIVQSTSTQNLNGVMDPVTGKLANFAVTQWVNGPAAEVRGIEFAIQHMFADTGFGLQLNATKVDTNKPYDANDTSTSGFAVTGLADSANFVGFYEKNGFEARVALNWRDEYLDHFGQQQNGGRFGTEPTFVNASTTVDFSTSYQFASNFDVYFEALNLTDETFSTHGRYDEQVLDVVDFGRRYTLGFHFRL